MTYSLAFAHNGAYDLAETTVTIDGHDITVPVTYSENAARTLATRYARENIPLTTVKVAEPGIPLLLARAEPAAGTAYGRETSYRQIYDRIAGALAYHAVRAGILDQRSALGFYEDLRYLFAHQ